MRPTSECRSAVLWMVVLTGCTSLPDITDVFPPDASPSAASTSSSSTAGAPSSQASSCNPDPAPTTSIAGFVGCPPWACGSNGAWLGGNIFFHELNLNHIANDAGITIESYRDKYDNPMELEIAGDRLVAKRGGVVLNESSIDGSVLRLTRGPGTSYDLYIGLAAPIPFWIGPTGPAETVPVYSFTYSYLDPSGPCPELPLCQPSTEPFEGIQGLALIFTGDQGDRYDANLKTVTIASQGSNDDGWFNIACAGTAVAKMHLLRHTTPGSGSLTSPSHDQRQAMLKMLAADYCGTGTAFTIDRYPLLYSFHQPSWPRMRARPFQPGVEYPPGVPRPAPLSLDAIWNQDGALCLDTARLEHETPNIRVSIDHECESKKQLMLKPCPAGVGYDTDWGWTSLGYAISANAFPP